MAFVTIPSTLIEVGKAVKKELFQTIKDNLDDHESRISGLAGGANKIQVFEYNVRPDQLDIGRIIPADMTLAEFQAVHGAGWVIADGSSCTGSVYAAVTGHSIVPDLRDEFLRGVSGSVLLGTAYADSTAVNGLSVVSGGAHAHDIQLYGSGGTAGGALQTPDSEVYPLATTNSAGAHVHSLSGDSETRPQNFGVNFFIKINLSAQDNTLRIKASAAMTITSAIGYIVDNNGLLTSGNLEFDIILLHHQHQYLMHLFPLHHLLSILLRQSIA